jgi:hypothetical protein
MELKKFIDNFAAQCENTDSAEFIQKQILENYTMVSFIALSVIAMIDE